MDDVLFNELISSVKQAGAIKRGDRKPSRVFRVTADSIRALRAQTGMSQPKFATAIGVSVGTLRNWEQGAREPTGPAKVLLRSIQKNPEMMMELLQEAG